MLKQFTFLLVFLVGMAQLSWAQCTFTTISAGNFNDPNIYVRTGGTGPTGTGGCPTIPSSSSTIIINHQVTLNTSFTVGNGGTLTINATGSLIEGSVAQTLTIDRGTLSIAAVADRTVPRLTVSQLILARNTATIGANSAIQVGCFTLDNQGAVTLGNNALINVARDLTVTNGNGLVNGPATGEPAGIRVIGLFRGVGGGTNNVYTGTLVTCSQLNRTVSGCTVPGSTTPEAEQTPPAGANNDPTCRSVLPVTLTSFAAAANGQNVQLTWTTAQEKNNDRFEVERSTDGTRYELVATVRGKGNTSTASSYTATDAKPLAGTSYYRLRQVDFDGTATYSQVAVVRNSTQQVYLTPNPATSQLGFEYAGGELQWRIVNSVGQLMKQGSAQVSSSVDVSSLRAGVYFFEVSTGGQRSVQKFFKQD